MRILIGVASILVALLGVAPHFVGGKIESSAHLYLDQYQMPGYQYSLDVDRGYRSSVLTYGFSLDPEVLSSSYALTEEQIDEVLEIFEQFELNIYVQHGPLLTQNGFGLGLADAYITIDGEQAPGLAEYLAIVGADYLFTADGRMGFSGKGKAQFDVPAMQYIDPEAAIANSFSGLQGTADFEDFGRYSSTSGHSDGGNFLADDTTRVDIGSISFTSEMTMDERSVWFGQGKGNFLLDSVVFSSLEQEGSLEDLSIKFALFDGDTAESTNIEYSIGIAAFESNDFGVEDAEFSIVYENLSNLAMRNYMDLMVTMPIGNEEAIQAALLQFALAELPGALLLNPAITFPRIAFVHEGRTFDGNFRIAVNGLKLPVPVSFLRPDLLIPAVTADLNLDADEELVNDLLAWRAANSVDDSFSQNPEYELTPEMRQTMIDQQASMSLGIAEAQGFVLRDNGRIKASLHLADRVLDINGTEMPLPF